MKKLFVNLIFILVAFVAHAQFPAPQPPPLNKDMIRVGKLFWLNTSDTTEFSASSYRGAIMYRAADKSLYVSDSTRWVQVASGGDLSQYMKYADTTSLSSRIDQKLNTSDTLDMLSSYLRKVDTTGKWKPLLWFPGVSEVIGLQDSLSDRYTKGQSDARYLQGNQTITLSGDVLGSGATAISTTLKNTGTAGTYTKVTTDAQGRVTSGTQLAAGDIPNLSSTYIPVTQKGAANGVATLGGDGKVTPSQLPVTGGGFLGQWNASTNTPTLADGVGSPGEYYRVSTAGTVNLGSGSQTFAQGDAVVYTAAGEWIKDPNYQAVSSVNGKVGVVVIDKSDVGLSNVDNTSDLAKPISTATQTALNGKEPTIAPGTTAQYWRGDKTWQTLSTSVRPLFSAGTGLTYNSSTGAFAANFGTTAGTIMQGNDSRVTGAVPNTRTITAGTGLTGGGDLTANRSFAIDPAYASFTNYYTKTNLQTSGQAAVHWGNLTNVPGSFPTTSNLQTVLSNGNTATNSITLGANGNSTAYLYNIIRRIASTDYTSTVTTGVPPGGGAAAQLAISDGATTKSLYVRHADAAPTYTPDGTNLYTLWHSNNHPAGSAFTPTLTGANVLSSLTVNSAGHVSVLTTRAMTAADIGAQVAGSYVNLQGSTPGTAQTGHINISGTLTASAVNSPSGSDLSISAPASHSLFFNPGGTNRGVWDGDGRLGIGTTPNSLRASLLEVNGNVWATDAYILGTTNVPTMEVGLQGGGTNGSGFVRMMGTGNLDIQTGASNTRIQINGTTGNVGIGMSASSYNLQVAGSMAAGSGLFTVDAFGQVSAPNVTVSNIMSSGAVTTDDFTLTDGTQGNGKVLTSDAGGHATWQPSANSGNLNVQYITGASYSATDNDAVLYSLKTAAPGPTITIPSAAGRTGKVYYICVAFNGAALTATLSSSSTIYGLDGNSLTGVGTGTSIIIVSDGTNWRVIK